MKKRPDKAVIFDCDGTLVESQRHFNDAIVEFSTMRGLPYDVEKVAVNYVDPKNLDMGWGVPLEDQQGLLDDLNTYMNTQMMQHDRFVPTLFDGMPDVLVELKEEYAIGMVTARYRHTLNYLLNKYNLVDTFPHFRSLDCSLERGHKIKPAADSLVCLLSDMRYNAKDVVVIGDTTSDILMASNAGAKSIGVLWGVHSQERLATANPNIMIDQVSDLPKTIRSVFSL